MKKLMGMLLIVLPLAASGLTAVTLAPQTVAVFNSYIQAAENRIEAQDRAGHLWVDDSPERKRPVDQGGVIAEPWSGSGTVDVTGGLIQDWIGAVFVRGVTLDQTLALVQNYDLQKRIYGPGVEDSRIVSHDDGHFIVHLRLLKKKMTTLVLNVTEDVQYFRPKPDFAYNFTRATKIAEVEDAGKPDEHELPPGKDHGYLWRMNSYWRFAQRDGGVYVESEVITLTRDLPTGLGWLIKPMIRSLPRDGLVQNLEQTRAALTGK
jgi:hypothetical protein